ncbi:MAG TPA: tRNA lysidine(34) synthetase TilS [Vitreimonas sp.]|uniref:tRNA lysidine(34) synthetase TilS n=1 Tax=Vitreimonas sp. TaxID=3069702 RepID=UPI002D4551A3|nr:tRNA lysidine(34) synthetase TilS [Vitreimonas sp.]HYD88192.1 tRNA lysidine(34) synthetase TilS [Vitreimonas sp.]
MLDRVTIEQLGAAAGKGPILVALSGGGDSLALLHLLVERLGAQRLRAAIVDHALREGSAADAARAAESAEAAGVGAYILTLTWPDGANRAQSAAREARYSVLCAHARALGAHVVATGHTRDDQAETVLLRAARGSGWRGLAAMAPLAPMPIWPEGRRLLLARPLLVARRADLRAYLGRRGVRWLEDPANANPSFARVRARAALAQLSAAGLEPMRFATLAERLAPHARALDDAALALIAHAVSFDQDNAVIDRDAWRGDEEVRVRALNALLVAVGGSARTPDARAGELAAAFTLSGALVRPTKHGVRISRDPGALAGRADGARPPPPLELTPGVETVWDNRVAVVAMEPGWSVIVESGAPWLARGAERRPFKALEPEWLLRPRVEHLLGRINDTKPV